MFSGGGSIGESVYLALDELHGAFVLVVQAVLGDGDGESMASVFIVPRVITQFLYVKILVEKKSLASPK